MHSDVSFVLLSLLLVLPAALAQSTSKDAVPSERDKAGLRGAVKTLVTETAQDFPDITLKTTSTTTFANFARN